MLAEASPLTANGAYVSIDGVHDGFGTSNETDTKTSRQDLAQAIKAYNATDVACLSFKLKVRWWARCGAEIDVVIRVVYMTGQLRCYEVGGAGRLPSRIMKLCSRASLSTSNRRSSVCVMPVGLEPYWIFRRHMPSQ